MPIGAPTRKAGSAAAVRARHTSMSGGSIDTDVKELTVMPTGAPAWRVVMTVTPVGKAPAAALSSCGRTALPDCQPTPSSSSTSGTAPRPSNGAGAGVCADACAGAGADACAGVWVGPPPGAVTGARPVTGSIAGSIAGSVTGSVTGSVAEPVAGSVAGSVMTGIARAPTAAGPPTATARG